MGQLRRFVAQHPEVGDFTPVLILGAEQHDTLLELVSEPQPPSPNPQPKWSPRAKMAVLEQFICGESFKSIAKRCGHKQPTAVRHYAFTASLALAHMWHDTPVTIDEILGRPWHSSLLSWRKSKDKVLAAIGYWESTQ